MVNEIKKYWYNRPREFHYFWINLLFEQLYHDDEYFKQLWDAVDSRDPELEKRIHYLQNSFSNQINDTVINWMSNPLINISKLTRRYENQNNNPAIQTVYEYLISYDFNKTKSLYSMNTHMKADAFSPNMTFVSCWYELHSNHPTSDYNSWINNMLTNVNNYYLVIYTDMKSYAALQPYAEKSHHRIHVIIKEKEEFVNFKYRDFWERNHLRNMDINLLAEWTLNMLWSEKVHFVAEVVFLAPTNNDNKFSFSKTHYYGWCDIGYFRNQPADTPTSELKGWPNPQKINSLKSDRVYYAQTLVKSNNENPTNINYLRKFQNDHQIL